MKGNVVPIVLLVLYVIVSIYLGIDPYARDVWFIENLPIWMIVLGLVIAFCRWFRFSNTAYILMSFLIFMHTIWGHFTFERVPFDLVTEFFGFERNHYDRIAHFSVWFYAFAVAEVIRRKNAVNSNFILYSYPILFIFAIAGAYEIIEWWYAAIEGWEAGAAFLGSQWDIWDAQKDMLADVLGAVFAMVIYKIWTCAKRV